MPVRVGINGFGRIGRNFFRAAKASGADIDSSRSTTSTDAATLAHLLKYDSVLGRYQGVVEAAEDGMVVDGETLKVVSHRDPADLPWADLGVDVVLESTGFFADRRAEAHLTAGAKQGRHLGAREGPRRDARARRQRGHLRPRQASAHLDGVVHDQLPRARRARAARRVRHRVGLHDDDARLHRRPAPARRAALRPAARARRGALDHPDLDGRGARDRHRDPRAARASWTASRCASRCRTARSSTSSARSAARRASRRSTPRSRRRPTRAAWRGSSPTPRTRSSRRTSSATRTRRSSTRS